VKSFISLVPLYPMQISVLVIDTPSSGFLFRGGACFMLSIVGNGSVAADITSFLLQSPAHLRELICLGKICSVIEGPLRLDEW